MNFAIILSGCGVFDGSEINEAALTALFAYQENAAIEYFAPNIEQTETIDHLKQQKTVEKRNVLSESARIARGSIKDIKELNVSNFDGIIFPGGVGVIKNLCSYAYDGAQCSVNKDVESVILEAYKHKTPLGFVCIAPILAAKVLGDQKITVTIGNDVKTARDIESFGATHQSSNFDEVVVDKEHKIVSTPAYMLAKNSAEAALGIQKLVKAIIGLKS